MLCISPYRIGPYHCSTHQSLPYNMTVIVARGPQFRRGEVIKLRCTVSDELLEQLGYTALAPMIVAQLDQATEEAYRLAPIMRRKMHRYAKTIKGRNNRQR